MSEDHHRRPPTSADVARAAKVSRATVSYVLNDVADRRISEETRQRVRDVAAELGYIPHAIASSLRAGHNNLILVPLSVLPMGPMLLRFYDELSATLQERGYTVIFHSNRSAESTEAARAWAALRPAGLIVEMERLSQPAVEILHTAGTRAVLTMGSRSSAFAPTLLTNHSAVGARAAEHLIAQGHRHLAAIVPREPGLRGLGEERFSGVETVVNAKRLTLDRIDLAYEEAEAAQWVAEWKRKLGPTGIFTYNDEYALLLMSALQDAGVTIPDEVALVGADNLPLCTLLRPRLSSIHLEIATTAQVVAEAIHAMIQGRANEVQAVEMLRPQVVAREST